MNATDFFANNQAAIGVLGALFGGAGLRWVDKMLSRRTERYNEAERIRAELRIEVDAAKEENKKLSEEVIIWRERYWKFYEEAAQLRMELARLKTTAARISRSGSVFD